VPWRDRSRGDASRRRSTLAHPWEKVGIALLAVLLLVLAALVMVSPSSPSQSLTITTLAPLPATTSTPFPPTTNVAARAPAPTTAPTTVMQEVTATAATSSAPIGSRPPGCLDPDDCPTAGAQTVDHGLRIATAAEMSVIAAEVAPPPGQQVDSVMLSISAPTWGVLHVAAGAGHGQVYVLIEFFMNGKWAPVDSGYPRLRCDEAIPSNVLVDLGSVGTLCP
jgi:hypothetical protein